MPGDDVLASLPELDRLRRLTRALAVLDAIMEPRWDLRLFSFDAAWHEGEQMASLRDGSGDNWFCWLGPPGAAIVGFAHEAAVRPGLLDGVPDVFRAGVLEEPAFSIDETTFLVWREHGDRAWQATAAAIDAAEADDLDGARSLLEPLLRDQPAWYVGFAAGYHSAKVDPEAVAAIYAGAPVTPSMCAALNPDRDVDAALEEVSTMGHPTA